MLEASTAVAESAWRKAWSRDTGRDQTNPTAHARVDPGTRHRVKDNIPTRALSLFLIDQGGSAGQVLLYEGIPHARNVWW